MNWAGLLRWFLLNLFGVVVFASMINRTTRDIEDPVVRQRKIRQGKLIFSPFVLVSIYYFWFIVVRDCNGGCTSFGMIMG